MSVCPQCGGEDLEEFDFGGNAYCRECGEVVEPVDDVLELADAWECANCGTGNLGAETDCIVCGLSQEASQRIEEEGVPWVE